MVSKVTPDTMMSASRLPALMGYSKYNTPNDELQYSIRALKGEPRPDIGNEAMAWGNVLEPMILAEAAKRLELIDLITDHPEARYHAKLPLCCSLDGTADGRGQVITTDTDAGIYVIGQESITLDGVGVLEAKATSMAPEDAPALHRGPIQLQAQMDIVEAKWGAVCVLYQGMEMRIFLFAPHAATVSKISEAVIEFQSKLQHFRDVGAVDFYPPQSSKDADRMYPDAGDAAVITLPIEAEDYIDEMKQAKKDMEDAELRRSKAEAALKDMLGPYERGIAGQWKVSWPMRNYKAAPEKIVPAKPAYTIRQTTIKIEAVK